ncbi:hypothetical protein ACFSTH_04480 [Paenibacillus yanchengensis]|uniref:GapA-binding peptide SR1P n=1 Tax=Paenibacillus yanchengensis TaxID=2035833 RepID=A0ABW4YJX7_9BACL
MKRLVDVFRTKVMIRCNLCGEKYILRGRRIDQTIDTGFKQCICDNTEDLHMEEYSPT